MSQFGAYKTTKTVADIAAPDQALAAHAALRLLDQVRARIRTPHHSIRTEQAYLDWIKRYNRFFDKRHPRELLAKHVDRFPSRPLPLRRANVKRVQQLLPPGTQQLVSDQLYGAGPRLIKALHLRVKDMESSHRIATIRYGYNGVR